MFRHWISSPCASRRVHNSRLVCTIDMHYYVHIYRVQIFCSTFMCCHVLLLCRSISNTCIIYQSILGTNRTYSHTNIWDRKAELTYIVLLCHYYILHIKAFIKVKTIFRKKNLTKYVKLINFQDMVNHTSNISIYMATLHLILNGATSWRCRERCSLQQIHAASNCSFRLVVYILILSNINFTLNLSLNYQQVKL